ncbi:acetylglutamate kinase [Epilithonimonas xixisoli]|uniref:Acetylglutamate kinase n=1 Tax=Epilithonimonas xixisoli TaxID=1476462 RepID=A0A4R8I9N9_9FLAO|nr:acetylglutamate kinase [Epilithonimonas xixisoli]TDX86374.1 N-acetylglutamate kinase [Epilithonimonas xixisoli]
MNKLHIIKIGGALIDDKKSLKAFLEQFSQIEGAKILIHGGGKVAETLAEKLKITQTMIDGRRITNKKTLKLVTMVYAGRINKNIVAKLQSFNCNAMGFSGADGNLIQAEKRQHPTINFGFVGDINEKSINQELITNMINLGLVPVFSAITHDKKGNLLNTNADTIAGTIAQTLSKNFETELLFCFDKNGVLENIEDENSNLKTINKQEFSELKSEGKLHKGILPKLENAFRAKENGVQKVSLINEKKLSDQIKQGNEGTEICL